MKIPQLPSVPLRVLVCGSRDATDELSTRRVLHKWRSKIDCIIVGGASGVDTFAEAWGKKNGIPVVRIDAQWTYYGRGAGPIRNEWMLRLMSPDLVIAMPGGTGTADMVRQAKKRGIRVVRPAW